MPQQSIFGVILVMAGRSPTTNLGDDGIFLPIEELGVLFCYLLRANHGLEEVHVGLVDVYGRHLVHGFLKVLLHQLTLEVQVVVVVLQVGHCAAPAYLGEVREWVVEVEVVFWQRLEASVARLTYDVLFYLLGISHIVRMTHVVGGYVQYHLPKVFGWSSFALNRA